MPSTPSSSTETGQQLLAVYDRIHSIDLMVRELQTTQTHEGWRVGRIEEAQKELRSRIAAARREAQGEIAEINRRLQSAILWLALGAGGLLLRAIGPKLGL